MAQYLPAVSRPEIITALTTVQGITLHIPITDQIRQPFFSSGMSQNNLTIVFYYVTQTHPQTTKANAAKGSVYTIHSNKYIEHLPNKPATSSTSDRQV